MQKRLIFTPVAYPAHTPKLHYDVADTAGGSACCRRVPVAEKRPLPAQARRSLGYTAELDVHVKLGSYLADIGRKAVYFHSVIVTCAGVANVLIA